MSAASTAFADTRFPIFERGQLERRSAVGRVAAFLLDLDESVGIAGTIDLPMTRRDIADYLGLTLETVSRSLSQLQSEGALVLSDARPMTLHRRVLTRMLQT